MRGHNIYFREMRGHNIYFRTKFTELQVKKCGNAGTQYLFREMNIVSPYLSVPLFDVPPI